MKSWPARGNFQLKLKISITSILSRRYSTMAPEQTALAKWSTNDLISPIDPSQTLRAATALLKKIQTDQANHTATASKSNLLADADEESAQGDVPVWLVLTTKKHIVDKKRLKPGKIQLPHPILDGSSPNLRICLITADPQRKYKELVAHQAFPLELGKNITRVIGVTKLKEKYKSFESRRQLLGEYDVFFADDRIITSLPNLLGKPFYKSGNKRPVPITLEGKRQTFDEQGNKRRKLSEGGTKVTKSEVKPADVASEIERAVSSALVHLAPSTTTAVKVGASGMEPKQLQDNVEAVTQALVDKYVPQKWSNVKSVHMKGPNTAALPIWFAEELWEDEKDVLEEPLPAKQSKKRKRGALAEAAANGEAGLEVIEVPGNDGQMRKLEKSDAKKNGLRVKASKKRKSDAQDDVDAKAAERAEKAARKEALQKQKAVAKSAVNEPEAAKVEEKKAAKSDRKPRAKAADLI